MTAEEAFDKLQAFLKQIDEEAELLVPGHVKLTHIIRAYQGGPAPRGSYGLLTLQASTDMGETDHSTYRQAVLSGMPRVIEKKSRTLGLQFSLDVFADNALSRISRFRLALLSDAAPVPLYPWAIRDIRRAGLTGELIGEAWQGRAALTIELVGIECAEFAIDVIETGKIDLEAVTNVGNEPTTSLNYVKP